MVKNHISAILTFTLFTMLVACRASAQSVPGLGGTTQQLATADSTPASDPAFQQRFPRYRISAGDTVDINFTFSPEFNQSVTVQPDGFINLKEIGDVHVQDQTTAELAATVTTAYSKILRDPVVSVVLKDFNKPYFIAGGEVHNPGKYELRENTSVAQAVQVAGGFTEAAKHSEVWLYRKLPNGQMEVKKLNLKKMLAKGDLREDVRLNNGDMLFVPQNTISKVKGLVVPKTTIAMHP